MFAQTKKTTITDQYFNIDVTNASLSKHIFTRSSAMDKTFKDVNFKYCTFDSCYFRKCVFDSCDFTGCRFIGTNMRGSSFRGCKFEYATFEKTLVDDDILDTSCPSHENLRQGFARTLRVNYQQLGDTEAANKAIKVELQATEIHLHNAVWSNISYYRNKYSGWKKFSAFLKWSNFKFFDFIWGNGESWQKLLRAAVVSLVVIEMADALLLGHSHTLESFQIFLGAVKPYNYPTLYLASIEFFKLILFGLFISIIVKRFSRR